MMTRRIAALFVLSTLGACGGLEEGSDQEQSTADAVRKKKRTESEPPAPPPEDPWMAQGTFSLTSPSFALYTVHSGVEHVRGIVTAPAGQLIRAPITITILGGAEGRYAGGTFDVPSPVASVEFDIVVDTTQIPNGSGYCYNVSTQFDYSGQASSVCGQIIQNEVPWYALGTFSFRTPSFAVHTVHSGTEHVTGTITAPPGQLIRAPITLTLLGGPAGRVAGGTFDVPAPVASVDFDIELDTTLIPNGEDYCYNISTQFDYSGQASSACSQVIQN